MSSPVLEIEGLTKTFRSGFRRRAVRAVSGLSLQVSRGSVVAFVGPNGAGKTTSILSILGFLKPEQGRISVFGVAAGSREARRRLGFQSEIFHTYRFHTARRSLAFYAKLSGVPNGERADRIERQLARLGLRDAAERKVGTFSKGMMQRLGLAQALLHEPELLILDEPTTGLDPEGRKLVAEIILEEKARGRTVFLSSHILSDVERTCDRVVMIRKGEVVLAEDMDRLAGDEELWELDVLGEKTTLDLLVAAGFHRAEERPGAATFLCSVDDKRRLLQRAAEKGLDVESVRRRSRSLEDLYMEHVGGSTDG
jgi:ABC-2 type transport system ATP-binding protein